MKIEFKITTTPDEEQRKYLTAYLEGILYIYIEKKLFFKQPGILLIELAIFITRWLDILKEGNTISFIYETMDYDEPILKIDYMYNNYFRIRSIWQEIEVKELLSKENITTEFEKYLSNLSHALKLELGINLADVIENTQE